MKLNILYILNVLILHGLVENAFCNSFSKGLKDYVEDFKKKLNLAIKTALSKEYNFECGAEDI